MSTSCHVDCTCHYEERVRVFTPLVAELIPEPYRVVALVNLGLSDAQQAVSSDYARMLTQQYANSLDVAIQALAKYKS
jgi:hypothetical protein